MVMWKITQKFFPCKGKRLPCLPLTLHSIGMKQLVYLFALLPLALPAQQAQRDVILLTHTAQIDENRYSHIKGSPYFFDEWMVASIESNEGEYIRGFLMNLNGHTAAIEVKKGERFMELDAQYYKKITLRRDQNPGSWQQTYGDSLLFCRGLHKKFGHRMVLVIYRGERIALVNDFTVSLLTKEVQDVGKTVSFQSFFKQNQYYLIQGADIRLVKLNKKKLLEQLGHTKELEKYVKSEKIRFNSLPDLQKLLTYYEHLNP
ncbi:MAG: hypothetical protein D6730_11995 [Bacteroidetes bacterium]|nr:MAG: hypothetical protein D6730_11995 [Bacteroidota bacterium]